MTDLTTILVVNNDNNGTNRSPLHGRYLNVKPVVGVLKTTARTFIQEGVTTEYATQVLGTTLDNGRYYAQLLKKGSRVIYDKDTQSLASSSSIIPTSLNKVTGTGIVSTIKAFNPQKTLLQSHNDLVADQDWQLIDDHLLAKTKNTDFIDYPNNALLVYSQKPNSKINENDLFDLKNSESVNLNNSNKNDDDDHEYSIGGRSIQKNINEIFKISQSTSSSSSSSSLSNQQKNQNQNQKISPEKVKPAADLPTFTVKNMFAPSGFSWDSSSNNDQSSGMIQRMKNETEYRSPKFLFRGQKRDDDLRSLSTITYYGFADFTTTVGDTIIVFSPSTSSANIFPGQITSIKGEATLGQKKSYVSHLPISVNQDLIEPTTVSYSTTRDLHTLSFQISKKLEKEKKEEEEEKEDNREEEQQEGEDITEAQLQDIPDTTPFTDNVEITTLQDSILEYMIKDDSQKELDSSILMSTDNELEPSISSSTLILSQNSDEPTPQSTSISSKVMLTKPSDEDISKIFASLSAAEAAKKSSSEQIQKSSKSEEIKQEEVVTIEPETKIFGGVTTIFFENDPFQQLAEANEAKNVQEEKSVQTDDKTSSKNQEIIETDKTNETIKPSQGDEQTSTSSFSITSLTPSTSPVSSGQTVTEPQPLETTENITTESEEDVTQVQQQSENENCVHHSTEIIPTLQPKVLTYFTTFFLTDDNEKTTSVSSNIVTTFDVSYTTKLNCIDTSVISPTTVAAEISPSNVIEKPLKLETDEKTTITTEETTNTATTTTTKANVEKNHDETTPIVISTEKIFTTESNNNENIAVTDDPEEDDEDLDEEESEDDDHNSGEEIELLYKTLYTTYTYLTTFFHNSTMSVSSRKEIVTNVITSTINPTMLRTDLDVSDILSSMTIQPTNVLEETEVSPTTSVGIGRPTTKFVVLQSDLVQIDDILREEKENVDQQQQQPQLQPTEVLNDVSKNGIKTYYTTYTYYTTIFVDGETEVLSRTEVYTNYEQGISPSATAKAINFSKEPISDNDNLVFENMVKPVTSYETLKRSTIASTTESGNENESNGGEVQLSYSTLTRTKDLDASIKSEALRDQEHESSRTDDENVIKMVTDVRSSSSDGDRHIIENVHKQWNGLLEDQVSSESNTEDILPSSTLLLQTSYTTFTFYTTMYSGTQTNVISRLETVTNIVTETLQPTQTVVADDAALPITYFTTFTYWTTLVKDAQITTISREETVSNVISPTATLVQNLETTAIATSTDEITTQNQDSAITKELIASSSSDDKSKSQENPYIAVIPLPNPTTTTSSPSAAVNPTTFYTTFTYYTTSYANDETIINSRFETVTNVISPTVTLANSPIKEGDVLTGSTTETTQAIDENTSSTSSPSLASDVVPSATTVGTETSSDYVSLNQGKIIDAEGVSTIFYTTRVVPSTIDGKYTELTQSTSSFTVDESKKSLQSLTSVDPSSKAYKTGLVRLIDGTIIANKTTTLYQSKVIGTVIDGRYAQIIESTSSFVIEKTVAPTKTIDEENISPTATQSSDSDALHTVFTPTPALNVIESSINKDKDDSEGSSKDENEEESEGDVELDENGRPKTRLTYQTKKKIFTPVIRPFASRNRPQFAPKRKLTPGSSVQIVTRSDFTPTITATPAIKAENSRGRFNNGRRSSSSILSSSIAGSSRRFSRPRSSTSSSVSPATSGPRGRPSSSRISPTSTFPSSSTRRGGVVLRGSSTPNKQLSSAYLGNSRNRIRPTSTSAVEVSPSTSSYTTQETDTEEETVTENSFDNENNEGEPEANTENTRRNQNPLLRFRRPPLVVSPRTTSRTAPISTRRNPLAQRTKTTTSTTTTTTTQKPRSRTFQRPALPSFQNRPRPQSSLFPPRGLFRQQQVDQELDEETENNDDLQAENADYDDEEGEEEEDGGEDAKRRRRHSKTAKKRSKRQTDYGSRNFRSRLRRPTTTRSVEAQDRADTPTEEETSSYRARPTNRYSSNRSPKSAVSYTSGPRIRPTKPTTTNRPQFTLREKDTVTKSARSNFRRPTTSGLSTSRRTTTVGRPKTSRLKTYINAVTEQPHTSRSTSGRTRTTSRGRSTTRARSRNTDYQNKDSLLSDFDGTITVTHHIPTEITIPVVNGKVTEFKHVITDKVSTEILGPNQYNTLQGLNGESVIVLNREDTNVNNNGATEVTQFVLHKIPTTSILFTPTTIRGRRTSFSHIIPSTVYDVENIISTVQPQIAASAPLANILLSQLLLGNIGIPNQNALNPLIGLGAQPGVPGTPTTEYKTRTTSYVTTVTRELSTVIPLTFRGKQILTTIVDSSTNVITATEYITDTTVITPTMPAVPQVNSLLLPLLLQQQQAQIQQNPILPIQNSILPQLGDTNVKSLLYPDNYQDLDTNRIHKTVFDDVGNSKESDQDDLQEQPEQEQSQQQTDQQAQSLTTQRKRHRKGHKQPIASTLSSVSFAPLPSLETSVITLYVSGRRPGEFSTVLSTIIGNGDSSVHKRQIDDDYIDKSATVDYEDFYSAAESDIKEYLVPATNEIVSSHILSEGTQSLESIVGDVSKWYENTASENSKLFTIYKKSTDLKYNTDNEQIKSSNNDENKSVENKESAKYFLV